MKTFILSALFLLPFLATAQDQSSDIPRPELQIKTASLPVPEDQRDGVTVYGYDQDGEMVVLREGSNNLVCLADDPEKKGISVSCYNKKLDPFMARGRELKQEGKSTPEIREVRRQEVDSGNLQMPDAPSMLYVLSGDEENYNQETGELQGASLRYVIYTPFATTESTGLPDKPHAPGMPWLMDPGTHRAHIMITPPRE